MINTLIGLLALSLGTVVQAQIATGIATGSVTSVSVDYATTTTTAGKFIFGICSWPKLHTKYGSLVAESGITILRDNIYLYDIVPRQGGSKV